MNPDHASSTDYETTLHLAAPATALYAALTNVESLSAWWTRATGSGAPGDELRFYFGPDDPCVVRVEDCSSPTSVTWTVTECAFLPDWVGTHPTFDIVAKGGHECELRFSHRGLTTELECFDKCSRGWGTALDALRRFVTSRVGISTRTEQTRIHQEAVIDATPADVYDVLTASTKFAAATGMSARLGEQEGDPFTLFDGRIEGRQVELVPGKRLVQAWRFGAGHPSPWDDGVYSLVCFTLSPEGGGTRFVIDHTGLPPEWHQHISGGYPSFYQQPLERYFAAANAVLSGG